MTNTRRRRGVALFAALSIMTLIALLLAGAVASTTLLHRAAQLDQADATLGVDVDDALNVVAGDAQAYGLADLPLGTPVAVALPSVADANVRVRVTATRLPNGIIWLVADASRVGSDRARRRANLVLRHSFSSMAPIAGVMTRRAVALGPDTTFTSDPNSDPDCRQPAQAPVALLDSAGTSTYLALLNAVDSSSGALHVRHDTTLDAGSFTGIIAVDGTLRLTGAVSIDGLLLVAGRIVAAGGSLTLNGAMLALAPPADTLPPVVLSAARIRYSPCAVTRAVRHAFSPRPVRQRSWAELF